MIRSLQYAFIAIVTISVGFSLYQWNASRAAVKLQQSTSVNLTNGLVGYWSFDGDDVSGTTAYDRSGSANNGTLTNGPTRTAGRIGQALSFDGTNDSVAVSSDVIGSGATSICAWVNPRSMGGGGYGRVVSSMNGATHKTILLMEYPSPLIAFSSDGGTTSIETSTLSYNRWIYVCATRDASGSASIYLDGVLNITGATGTPSSGANTTYVGNTYDGSRTFDGAIDDMRIYNRQISAGEIQSLYDLGNPDKVNTPQGDPLEQGLVGYWKLDDASGTTATDSSGNANTGTLTNGPTWGTGQIKGDTVFDGTDDYIQSNLNKTVIGNTPSISFWVRSTGAQSTVGIIQVADALSSNSPWILFQRTNATTVQWYINGGYRMTQLVSDNTWYHIVLTYDGTTWRAYKNGVADGTYVGSLGGASGNFTWFGNGYNGYFNGQIDEVRVYNRALSDEEVTKLYRETTPDNPDTGLVGYWPMNGKDINGTTAYDRSGKGNTGTLTNGPTRTAGRIGQALNFDGTDDYVITGNTTAFDSLFSSGLTFCTWAKFPNFSNYNRLITLENNAGTDYDAWIQTQQSSAIVQFGAGGAGKFKTSTTALSTNTWYYLCGVTDYTAGGTKIFINGTEDSGTLGGTPTYTSDKGTLDIGRLRAASSSLYGTGQIDEPRIYNRALSAGEVQSLYDLGNPDKVNTPQGDPLEQGLVGYWKLDDASGTTATDSSGNGSNGTLTNGPTWGTGRIGGDTVFDGTDDYINISGNPSHLQLSRGTISAWIKTTNSTAYRGIIVKGNAYGLFLNSGVLEAYNWGTGNGASTGVNLADGAWHHVVEIFNSTVTNGSFVYIDGVLRLTTSMSILDQTITPEIGRGGVLGSGQLFTGSIDEVRVYNRALSDEEVTKLYRETTPDNPDTGLVGYWPMNGKDINGTTAYDRSGKGNTGTLTNGPTRTAGRIGQALTFDGVDDYVTISNDIIGTGAASICAWVYPRSLGEGSYGRIVTGSTENTILCMDAGMNFSFTSDGSGHTIFSAVTLGRWTHVCAIRDISGNGIIYKDGVSSGSGNTGTPISNGATTYIGNRILNDRTFDGNIDEVRIYNRALSSTEVSALYNAGR